MIVFDRTYKSRKVNFQILNSLKGNPSHLFDKYIDLEKEIQRIINQISGHFCGKCSGNCCREEICKESIKSPFLSILIKKQSVRYDCQNGWLSSTGCRLDYGRPLVCYDFFCDDVSNSYLFKTSNIQTIINDFVSIGNNAYGNTHLVCIENLNTLSSKKIKKIFNKICSTYNNLSKSHSYTETIKTQRI